MKPFEVGVQVDAFFVKTVPNVPFSVNLRLAPFHSRHPKVFAYI